MNDQTLTANTPMPQMAEPQVLNPQVLDLRDIHLPEAISWWPVAPGWWIIAAGILILLFIIFISRKIYINRQLKRDISSEINIIKQQFEQTQNKSELARSLSILLRRASISYYPAENIAGLTGENWLALLDQDSLDKGAGFQSETGKLLITAPYQSEQSLADFDAQSLIQLCESWLLSSHDKRLTHRGQGQQTGASIS